MSNKGIVMNNTIDEDDIEQICLGWLQGLGYSGTANREIAKQFPDTFQHSEEMGWVPEGWEVKPLDKIVNYLNGLACQKYPPENETENLPVLKIKEFMYL